MLIRTHIAISVLAVFLLIGAVENKIIFFVAAIIATFIPDIDSNVSSIGRIKILRPIQFFLKHRGITHSFTFLFLITLFLVLFFPIVALGFFVGYALHLFADSFTIEGIQFFYPLRKRVAGKIKTGGKIEMSIFIFFVLVNLLLLAFKLVSIY